MSREETPWKRPAPLPSRNSQFFWDGAEREQLLGQRCTGCHEFRHPPRPMCPDCLDVSWEGVPLSGRGTVHSWMLPVHPRLPMFDSPLICVLVDLEEGIRIFSNLYECEPEEVENGMPVEVFFVPTRDDKKVPVFRPIRETNSCPVRS